MFRISEERMQRVQMMTWTEWLQAYFSPQLESGPGAAIANGLNDRPVDLKVTIHFDQSQVRVSSSFVNVEMLKRPYCLIKLTSVSFKVNPSNMIDFVVLTMANLIY